MKMLISIVVAVLFSFTNAAVKLNDYIQHYETLTYDSETVNYNHVRAKRSTGDSIIHINFHAHGRHFSLRLKRDASVFSKDLKVDVSSEQLDNFDLSHLYSGTLWGEKDTIAFGSIRDGVFDGKIITPKENYYVERANKYFSPLDTSNFHSIIYAESDVLDSAKHAGHPRRGITDDVKRWMESVQHSSDDGAANNANVNKEIQKGNSTENNSLFVKEVHNKYSEEAQKTQSIQKSRSKRASTKRVCNLYIQTDPFLWDHIHKKENDESKTRTEIIFLIAQHVKAANLIFENEDFGGYRGINFVVQRITINDTAKECYNGPQRGKINPFCENAISVTNFLDLNSQKNHDAFCLAYVFTYRDFEGGLLGLSWVPTPEGAPGGICESYKEYRGTNSGTQLSRMKRSLNTGIITFSRYNTRVPPMVSQLAFAHEIGHSFGSPHDWPQECRPGGQDGNYLMFAFETPGNRPHNSKFSECSKRNITGVLELIFQGKGRKKNCFLDDGLTSFCGNHIVEGDEECDCGYNEAECAEVCCYPRELSDEHRRETNSAPCKRRRGVCSPSEGLCCGHTCEFVNNTMCRADSDCNHLANCNGRSPQCPASVPKQNFIECNENTQVCINGGCIGSICLKYNLEECFLTKGVHVTPEQLCEVACQKPGQPDTCKSSFDTKGNFEMPLNGTRLRPGAPCDNFEGHCDDLHKCVSSKAEYAITFLGGIGSKTMGWTILAIYLWALVKLSW